jgi:hypothetical protein
MNKNIARLLKVFNKIGQYEAAYQIKKIATDRSAGNFFHGSPKKFNSFDRSKSHYRGLTYFTPRRDFAVAFAGGRGLDKGYIYTISFTKPLNLFDATDLQNIESLRPIIKSLVEKGIKDSVTGISFNPSGATIHLNGEEIKDPSVDQMTEWMLWRVKNKSWRILEGEAITKFIEEAGYDGIVTQESGVDNIGVFDTTLIRIDNIEEIEVDPD